MESRLTIVVENTAPVPGLLGEFGFSVHISWAGHSFLLDTGSQGSLIHNGRFLGIDFQQLEAVVLSHGHFDHTGGLPDLLTTRGETMVYLHPEAINVKLVKTGENSYRSIGLTRSPQELAAAGAVLDTSDQPREIAPGMVLTGSIPRVYTWEDTGGAFFTEIEGQPEIDPLWDDQALVLDTAEGLVVISGCAHSGLANTVACARSLFPGKKVRSYLGGTHLVSATPERLQRTREVIEELGIEELMVCHCTGFPATAFLYQHLGAARVHKAECGYSRLL